MHYIEGGWPGSNPKDIEFFAEAKRRKFKNALLAAFGSTRRKGVAVETDDQVRLLIEAESPVVTIYGKTWLLHVKEVLRATPDENLAMIADTVRFLKDNGRFVIYDAEHGFDGFKDDPEYAMATWQAAEKAGADIVVLCDTNGGSLPSEIARITAAAIARLGMPVGIHTHNDTGLGVANALAAVEAGAMQVQGTINGYGERTGNCNLTSVIPNLALKMGKKCMPDSALRKLKELSQFVDEIANIRHDPRQPWVGEAAFAHKGGTHVNAVQKLVSSYEHIDPARIGNARRVLVSDLAGRSNIVMKAAELGFNLTNDTPELKEILSRIKKLEHEGYEFEAAEGTLGLLIRKILKHEEPPFVIEGYHVSNPPRQSQFGLPGQRESAGWRPVRTHHRRGRRPGERAGPGAARGAGEILSRVEDGPAGGLQSAHPGLGGRHRRPHAGVDRVHRRQGNLGHGGRARQHHRGQPPGAIGQPGIPAVEE